MMLLFTACKKDFLDAKPDKSRVVPTTIEDLQAMLDNDSRMNNFYTNMGDIASDDVWTSTALLNPLSETQRNAYIWGEDIFNDNEQNDWSYPYRVVLYANIALEGIDKLTPPAYRQADWNNVKGSALFFRAYAFEKLLQQFAKPYDAANAAVDPGIALRLNANLNEVSVRSSVRQSYDQVIADATLATTLLPNVPQYKTRPSKAAAFGLLARTHLAMQQYIEAGRFADSALKYYNTLIDYNTLNATAAFPVPLFNAEVVFHCRSSGGTAFFNAAVGRIDSLLYKSYHNDDLRKKIFFKVISGNTVSYSGSYGGSVAAFVGIASDELYLIRAESKARAGDKDGAMNDLNILLQKRWKSGLFVPFTASTANEALVKVLAERRKELLIRNLRWSDLRRLNKEPQFAVTITKHLNNQAYTLAPNDNRYVFPIPAQVIQATGMPQNPR